MFVGDTCTGDGVLHLVLELLANAYDQHVAGRCSSIDLDIAADGTITVEDDGPGIPVAGGRGLPPLDELLTQRVERPTVDGHRPHVHLGVGGLGFGVINALSERLELTTVCDGREARALYSRGVAIEPIATIPTTRPSGTRIRFRPDPQIFRFPRVPRVALTAWLEDLAFLAPKLTLRWRIGGDDVAAGGLAVRVALQACCATDEVASHRGVFDTETGPIDVEVALAWLPVQWHSFAEPVIHSFVNLERSRDHGTHVAGMIDGAVAFLGGGRRAHQVRGLVAVVSVILTDVLWGNPAKSRLDSPQARAPVAEATRLALARWAEAHPAAAAALREHKQQR